MANEATIAQLVNKALALTSEQIAALNATTLPIEEIVKAVANQDVEAEVTLQMAQLDGIDSGVWSVARVAMLGILSEGKEGIDSALLMRTWEDVIEPFHTPTQAETEQEQVFDSEKGIPDTSKVAAPDGAITTTEVPNFQANLVVEGQETRSLLLLKLEVNGTEQEFLEIGTEKVWLGSELTDLAPYPTVSPTAGAI